MKSKIMEKLNFDIEEYLGNIPNPYTHPGIEKMVEFSGDQEMGGGK